MKLKELIEKLNSYTQYFGDDIECVVAHEEVIGIIDHEIDCVFVGNDFDEDGKEILKLAIYAPLEEDEDMGLFGNIKKLEKA